MRKIKKMYGVFAVFIFTSLIVPCFAIERFASIEQFKKFKSADLARFTGNELYQLYSENEVRFKNNFTDNVFLVYGTVANVRTSIFNEYIVELYTSDSLLSNLSVVYPSSISKAKLQDLAELNKGDYFEALVVGRSIWVYVDVLCYKLNGQTRTEL